MITDTYNGHVLRIYIDDILHLSLPIWKAMQSWKDEEAIPYKIEFYYEGPSILTEYDDVAKWTQVLKIVDRVEKMGW